MARTRSRFGMHYFFYDVRDTSQEFADKLRHIMKERFPEDNFLNAVIPYPFMVGDDHAIATIPFPLKRPIDPIDRTLFVGIGTGGAIACQMQANPAYNVVSVFAVCPNVGIREYPTPHPRVLIYPSSEYPYYFPAKASSATPDGPQVYGMTSLIHGPKLALYAIAFLLGKYLEAEDLSEPVRMASGVKKLSLLYTGSVV